jgi:hypothetical protein
MTDLTSSAGRADALAAKRRARENCRACGGAWFGEVAYCPYCGVSSASEPVAAAVDVDVDVDFPPATGNPAVSGKPETIAGGSDSWKSWAKPLAAGALVGVLLVALAAVVLKFF